MILSRSGIRTILAVAMLCFASCGKKEDVVPVLPAPSAVGNVAAQAEVKASSGPIELSLLLRETGLKLGESLWTQIRIRNVGEKEIVVADPVFNDFRELRRGTIAGFGIYLEVIGPDGKPLSVDSPLPVEPGIDISTKVSGLLEVERPEERAMVDGWRKRGLSLREINEKLIDFNTKKKRAAEIHQRLPYIKLQPGESVETKYAFFYSMQDKIENRPIPRAIGEFARLDFFVLDKPGKYKVRAVHNQVPTEKTKTLSQKMGLPTYPEEVRVETPWVQVEVLQ